ncbi:MAG: hypothetical protein KVP17_000058, partial [Porospora cf. gigantea B]
MLVSSVYSDGNSDSDAPPELPHVEAEAISEANIGPVLKKVRMEEEKERDRKDWVESRQRQMAENPWYEPKLGVVDAFNAFAHVEAQKAQRAGVINAQRVKDVRLGEITRRLQSSLNSVPVEEKLNVLEANARTLVLTHLPGDVREHQIRLVFHELSTGMRVEDWLAGHKEQQHYGRVFDRTEQDGLLSQAITRIRIVRDSDGLCAGYAFVEFEGAIHADKAMMRIRELNNVVTLPGHDNRGMIRHARVDWANTATAAPLELHQVYCGNLPPFVTEYELLHFLREAHPGADEDVVSVRLIYDDVTLAPRRFCFIRMKDERTTAHLLERFVDVRSKEREDARIVQISQQAAEQAAELAMIEQAKLPESEESALIVAAEQDVKHRLEEGTHESQKEPAVMDDDLPEVQTTMVEALPADKDASPAEDALGRLYPSKGPKTNPSAFRLRGSPLFLRRSYQRPAGYSGRNDTGGAGDTIANTTIFIANLSPRITEADLRGICAPFGRLVSVRVAYMKHVGFVTFEQSISVLACLTHLNGYLFKGQRLSLAYGRSRFQIPYNIRRETTVDYSAK